MNEEIKIEELWRQFNKNNPDGKMMEFVGLVAQQFNCSLQEAKDRSQHYLLLG